MKLRITVVLFALGLGSVCGGQHAPPNKFLPSIQERQRYSDVVVSATIVTTQATNNTKQVEGEERTEWIAEARVDRVFKGFLDAQVIAFKYYGLGRRTVDYFGPPYADFRPGIRYILFLKGEASNLSVTIPFYRLEIEIAPQQLPFDELEPTRDLMLARELVFAIQSAPQTIGRAATHYFSWVEELIGKKSVPLVAAFLNSSDALVRYQAAWWLSFRQVDSTVMNELKHADQDESIEEWARSGARNRLRDMAEGKYVP